MADLIDRQAAIKAIENLQDCYNGFSDTYDKACIIGVLEELPSAQPDLRYDEWCTDCKEYDQEKHCCPRWNRVIRTTLQDAQRTGRWILNDNGTYSCDQCHSWIPNEQHYYARYCIFCGARMNGGDDGGET